MLKLLVSVSCAIWCGMFFAGCSSDGTGVADVTVSTERTAAVQSGVKYLLMQSYYRGNSGYYRYVPIVDSTILWEYATSWSGPLSMSSLPGSGDMIAQDGFVAGDSLVQGIWRGTNGYSRRVPIINNVIEWTRAGPWSAPLPLQSTLPGKGTPIALAGFVYGGDTLAQSVWRGDSGYFRNVYVEGNNIHWHNNWIAVGMTTLPGSGPFIALDGFVYGNTLMQGFWRGDKGYYRIVPIKNKKIEWHNDWKTSGTLLTLPGSGTFQALDGFVFGASTANSTGWLESVTSTEIRGWAWQPAWPMCPIDVEVYINGNYHGTVRANQYRSDLLAGGIGNGCHGFVYPITFEGDIYKIEVYAVDGSTDKIQLQNSPQSWNNIAIDLVPLSLRFFDENGREATQKDNAGRLILKAGMWYTMKATIINRGVQDIPANTSFYNFWYDNGYSYAYSKRFGLLAGESYIDSFKIRHNDVLTGSIRIDVDPYKNIIEKSLSGHSLEGNNTIEVPFRTVQ